MDTGGAAPRAGGGVMVARPRVLVLAYACEPGRGSEPGAGWGLVRAIAEFADCTVLVGPSHAEGIASWQALHPDSGIHFVTVPERAWPRPGNRGRIAWFLAYLRWLPAARRVAAALHAAQPFDLAWHATYSVYWLPSPVVDLGLPSVWGPVGGAVTTPEPLLPLLGVRGRVVEELDELAVRALATLTGAERTAERATVILAQNDATVQALPYAVRTRARVLNHAALAEAVDVVPQQRGHELVVAAALEDRKGVALVLHALALASANVHVTIHGDGPARARLEQLARQLDVTGRVTFTGSVPRDVVQQSFATARAAIFTGLREEGGLALAEAMRAGTPVIVLANGGAETIARATRDPSRVTRIAPGDVSMTARSLAVAMEEAVAAPVTATGPLLDRRAAVRALRECAEAALPTHTTTAPAAAAPSCAVIMPVFNGERFIAAAMHSVLDQTHRNLRLVVVDDGSTDRSGAIATDIASGDARVTVLTTTNGGRARARNIGAAAVPECELVAFLDADDTWDRTKLAAQVAALAQDARAVGIGAFMRYISSTGEVLGTTGQRIGPAELAVIARGELAPFPISSCLVVRRAAFAQLGGFDEALREAEDLDFIARLARLGPIACVEQPLGSYRIHPDSAMARSRPRVNMYARFVRRRLAERDAGRDLTWPAFERTYRPGWRERRRDLVETWYRSAALWRGEGYSARAAMYGAAAALSAPLYTIRRALRQRVRAGA